MASPVAIPKQPPLPGMETYREKALRKFKQNPWVPIGCAATVGALTVAMFKLRRGQSQSFNYWLRARVAAQGITILALVAGTYSLRPKKEEEQYSADVEAERRRQEKAAREREEFEERLRGAEEAHAAEKELMKRAIPSPSASHTNHGEAGHHHHSASTPKGRSWLGWLGLGRGSGSSTGSDTDKK